MNLSVIFSMAGNTVSRATRESLNLCSRPLLLCTNRTSEATASTHLHKPSEATVSMASKYRIIHCPARALKTLPQLEAHNPSRGTPLVYGDGCGARTCVSRVQGPLSETHLQKSAPCKRTLSTTHTNQGCVHTVKCFHRGHTIQYITK